jgi:hypothetical protein
MEVVMRLIIVPFVSVSAFSDINTGDLFLSEKAYEEKQESLIRHELAHLYSNDPDHGKMWSELAEQPLPTVDLFKKMRKRLGIPQHIAANIGNISGVQNILTDYYLLQAYRRSSQQILGTIGHWEVLNEGGSGPTNQLIRLYPTPKGAFPVVVVYYPTITHFRSPQARMLASEMLLAETKVMVGAARRKIAGIPMPDGGSLALDGEALVAEGKEEKAAIIEKAIHLGEPMGFVKA